MERLPAEDQPDTFSLGPAGSIPSIDDDDPRFAEDRAAWSAARKKAQAMHSADELIRGLGDSEWRVRHEVVDRLIARAGHDSRTLPALLRAATGDSEWSVRSAIAMRLHEFTAEPVRSTLLAL